LFFVDVEGGKLICVEAVDEKDSRRVRRHVSKYCVRLGPSSCVPTS
jgi:hypothetical protein